MNRGWQVIPFDEPSLECLQLAISKIEAHIDCALADYKQDDDAKHLRTTVELQKIFIDGGFGRKIIYGSLYKFQQIMGMDLHIQKYPYLRIARPGKPQDNIGIHRDTLYGGTPYEISCVIPLTTMPPEGSLQVIDFSNTAPESDYPFEARKTDVVKNSDKHNLGFVYLKKTLAEKLDTHPVHVPVGSGLAFPHSLVHGQEVNNSLIPRFSVDIRLVNSLANIEWSRTVHKDYWEELCVSPITRQAREYYAAQR